MPETMTISSLDLIDEDESDFEEHPVEQFRPAQVAGESDTLETISVDSATPWLSRELQRLAKLRQLRRDWESSGALPPNGRAIEMASRVLDSLSEIDFPPDNLDPSTDEGVCISFRRANRYADIECFNTGEILAVVSVDGKEPVIWELVPAEIGGAIAKINSFIFG